MTSNTGPAGPVPSKCKPDEIRTYKRVESTELKAHIFLPDNPAGTGKHSVIAFFHPGGWTMGEPAWGYEICSHFSSMGLVAISFQYRLTSMGGYSPVDAISDAGSSIRWIRANKDELNIDSNELVACGISAGAHLAACTAIIDGHDDPEDDLSISCVPNAVALQSACLNAVIVGDLENLLQGEDTPENISPAHHVRAGLPPMCLIHGTADNIVPFESVKEFTEKSTRLGNRCELHPFEGTDHFFSNVSDGSRVFKIMDSFLFSIGFGV